MLKLIQGSAMIKFILSFSFVCVTFLNFAFAQTANPDGIVGTWTVQDGKAKVKIEKKSTKYTGKIVWLKPNINKDGKPVLDSKNKNKALQSRPLMGLLMLDNFVYDGDNVWSDGTIYDPEGGDTYSCKITLVNNQTLSVRGYIGISLFGRTDIWKRSNNDNMLK
jgi:uncharacterized protein (DUF2147 family)